MKVLVTGANGQLGYDVCKILAARNVKYLGVDINDFDITDPQAAHEYLMGYRPDAVIHCSAWTAVDAAEDQVEKVRSVNADGPRNIAAACRELNAKMVYISTDYVFPGTGTQFYETDDQTGPLGVYGATKLEGELAVKEILEKYFVVRVSWVFGKNGNNFVKTMLRLSETTDEVSVVDDQVGSPTYTADLAKLLCDMIETERYGTYHASNEGTCSFAEFAEEIFSQAGKNVRVLHISSSEYPTKARRPLNSRLSKRSLEVSGFQLLQTWQNALHDYLVEIGRK